MHEEGDTRLILHPYLGLLASKQYNVYVHDADVGQCFYIK